MNFDDYQKKAMRTATKGASTLDQLACAGLGLAGEAGETADLIKKVLFHGHPLDEATREKLIREAGDVQWYLALLADALDVPLSRIAETNIEKLLVRYPEGFDSERSQNRPAEDLTPVEGMPGQYLEGKPCP